MIESDNPSSWQDLQQRAARILRECGVAAEIEKEIQTARGAVRADLWAHDAAATPAQTYVLECKLWRKRVPQTVIHAFRTVVGDSGANWGAILSASSFQPGARAAAQYSNVRLLTWSEFQELFADRWFTTYFIPTVSGATGALVEYTEPINSRIFRKADALSEESRKEFKRLRETYLALGSFCLLIAAERYGVVRLLTGDSSAPLRFTLPLREFIGAHYEHSMRLPSSVLDAVSYRSLLEAVVGASAAALAEFDTVFGERA